MTINLSVLAEQDLLDIWTYTYDKWGEMQADDYLRQLDYGFRQIAAMPLSGKLLTEIDAHLRVYHCRHHYIFYLIERDEVIIIAVLHEKMDSLQRLRARIT